MSVPQIHILPIKKFLSMEKIPPDSMAIISASAPIEEEKIHVPHIIAYYEDLDYESPRSFSQEQAKLIASFVICNATSAANIYVCCNAGESRSPAIAASLCRFFNQEDVSIWSNARYHPNVLCFCRMNEELGILIDDSELDNLIHISRSAFQDAIRKARNQ